MFDLYRILDVPRTADAATIKAAYRKLAKSLHPDRNPGDARAERRFKEVSQAYRILSDPKTRARYDRGEIDGEGKPRGGFGGFGGPHPGGFDPRGRPGSRPGAGAGGPFAGFESIFERAFGGFGFRRGSGSGFGAAGDHPAFDDLLRGANRQAGPQRRPRGGDIRQRLEVDFMAAIRGGTERLTLADGRTLDVEVPAGIEDGKVLRLKGQGRPGGPGAERGDVLVEIAVRPHPSFTRKGDDIHLELPISLSEAVLGAKITVPTVDGQVRITVPPGSNSGQTLRLRGKGVARYGAVRGDQYVRLIVQLPDNPDPQMAADLQRWAREHSYEVRRDLEPA